MLQAEPDGARFQDLKMHVKENNNNDKKKYLVYRRQSQA